MSDYALAWTGVVIGAASIVLNLLQWHQSSVEKKSRDAHRSHLMATKQSLRAICVKCSGLIGPGGLIKTEPAKQVIRDIAYEVATAESQLDAALGLPLPEPQLSPSFQVVPGSSPLSSPAISGLDALREQQRNQPE